MTLQAFHGIAAAQIAFLHRYSAVIQYLLFLFHIRRPQDLIQFNMQTFTCSPAVSSNKMP